MKSYFLIFLLACVACTTLSKPVAHPPPPPDATALLGEDRAATFDAVVALLKESHYFNPAAFRRMNTTWESELEKPRARFMSATTAADVNYAFVSLINSLRDGHTSADLPPELRPRTKLFALPFLSVPIFENGRWGFIVLKSNHPEIQPGDRIVKYNGMNAAEMIAEYHEWYSGNSPETEVTRAARWLYLRDIAFVPPPVRTVIQFRRGLKQTPIEIAMDWQEQPQPPKDLCRTNRPEQTDYDGKQVVFRGLAYCVYDFPKKVKVVRYVKFRYDFKPEDLEKELPLVSYDQQAHDRKDPKFDLMGMDQMELIKYLKSARIKTIALDLRENQGGGLRYDLMAAFAKKPFMTTELELMPSPYLRAHPEMFARVMWSQLAKKFFEEYLKKNPDAQSFPRRPFYCQTEKCDSKEAVFPATGELADRKLWLITGPNCLSACDQVVAIFKLAGIAKTGGLPTSGSTSPYRLYPEFTLKNGMTVKLVVGASRNFAQGDREIEANPTPVDVMVKPTARNFDKYLEAVLRKILN